jgi:anti-sigma B factor antagonist
MKIININVRETSFGVVILDCEGKIAMGDGTIVFRNTVYHLIKQGRNKILLNFAKISYVDSRGVTEIINAFTSAAREGGKMKFLNLTKGVADLFTIVKLIPPFEVYSDEQTALESF